VRQGVGVEAVAGADQDPLLVLFGDGQTYSKPRFTGNSPSARVPEVQAASRGPFRKRTRSYAKTDAEA
jgi:hypothetical protein